MGIIKAAKLAFDYLRYDEDGNVEDTQRAVDGVDLDIQPGEFVAVLGHNGSGKSTFAKHINALLLPTEGTIWIDGIDTAKEPELWKIRQKAGMVFRIRITRSLVPWLRKMWDSDRKIWGYLQEISGNVWMKALQRQE